MSAPDQQRRANSVCLNYLPIEPIWLSGLSWFRSVSRGRKRIPRVSRHIWTPGFSSYSVHYTCECTSLQVAVVRQ